jgi:hypothetical protein
MKYYVEHLGVTITRTSDRTYTHCIVSVSSVAQGRINAEASARKAHADEVTYWTSVPTEAFAAVVNAGTRPASHPAHAWDVEFAAKYIPEQRAKAAASLAALGTEDAAAAAAVAAYDAHVKKFTKRISPDGAYWVTSSTWAGRPDLAAKAAAKNGGIAIPAQVR